MSDYLCCLYGGRIYLLLYQANQEKVILILFENKIQTTSDSPCRIYVTDFVSFIYNLKTMF
ncbi:hypothetical protein FJR77_07430 [Streptococcus shenyangsis]|uniref:Uncharacterized protein n=1 Tax=Streptococcus shenyangsis TaxID=2589786 RepID=A0ABY2YGX2_9STRE|nr:hypothetical protein [Streptococcus mitis]TPE39160.1 hypothetical protein FJR73_07030 [Streptococcus sp. D2]TPE39252.1 hypothetical protein FJR77_07430 [Streptococcus shenyangsis]MQQ12828.1 hypothetical protein [Streptococcus mitis]MQQ44654.1 hypothetical protein [Streptococcus mitis]